MNIQNISIYLDNNEKVNPNLHDTIPKQGCRVGPWWSSKTLETETNIYICIIFDFVSGDVEGQISNAAKGKLFSIIFQMILDNAG